MNDSYKPKILVFCCNWCSYAGADLAGVSRLQIKPFFRVIRTMCSARVNPELILKALQKGADGVLVLACHIGDCHYIAGNHREVKRVEMLRRLLSHFGLEPDRVKLDFVSAGEAQGFQRVVNDFIEDIRVMGPSPLKGGDR